MTVQTVSVSEVAEVLGISERRVQQLVGLGVIPKPARGQYDRRAATMAYAAYIVDRGNRAGTPHRVRLWAAKASIAELHLEQLRSELVTVSAVEQVWGEILDGIRHRVKAIPAKVADLVAGELNVTVCRDLLLSEIDAALTELSDMVPGEAIEDGVEDQPANLPV